MAAFLLSDLHLPAQPSPLRDAFIRFLNGEACQAQALYILGDLFEYWLGDDVGLPQYKPEIEALARLASVGVPVFFMCGNRDFLVNGAFAAHAGVRVLPDPFQVDLGGVKTLLSHGDQFCTADRGYQRWRRWSRRRWLQRLFLALPSALRRRIALWLRDKGRSRKDGMPAEIMDVTEPAVLAAFARHGVTRIIHGHTHRPAGHRCTIGATACERIVLADWREDRCECLRVEGAQVERVRLPLNAARAPSRR